MNNTYLTKRNELYGKKVADALKARHFEAYYCSTKEEALPLALSLIPKNDTVAWGGSETIKEIGLLDIIKKEYRIIDRDKGKTPDEKSDIMRQGLLADTFLMSSNAISEDGQLINIDGNGNRLAAMMFGPKNVIVVAGMNKVVKSVEDGFTRIRSLAAPVNAQRISALNPPCKESGYCINCKSKESICTYMVTTRISRPENRIKVILIGEELGY